MEKFGTALLFGAIGFTAGIIYSSNYYEKDPNMIFGSWKNSMVNGAENLKTKASEIKDSFVKPPVSTVEVVEPVTETTI